VRVRRQRDGSGRFLTTVLFVDIVDALTDLLALNRERVRGWGVVHALAWASGNGDADRLLVACARLLAVA